MKNLLFTPESWADYLHWQKTDKKILKRINELIKDTQRDPFEGIGKPEPLKLHFLPLPLLTRFITTDSLFFPPCFKLLVVLPGMTPW